MSSSRDDEVARKEAKTRKEDEVENDAAETP